MGLVTEVYQATRGFPKDEQFGLTPQIRRAAVSVPANIAEGHARKGPREYRNFLSVSIGSLAELETHLEIAVRLGYTSEERAGELRARMAEVGRMLHGLLRSLASPRV